MISVPDFKDGFSPGYIGQHGVLEGNYDSHFLGIIGQQWGGEFSRRLFSESQLQLLVTGYQRIGILYLYWHPKQTNCFIHFSL